MYSVVSGSTVAASEAEGRNTCSVRDGGHVGERLGQLAGDVLALAAQLRPGVAPAACRDETVGQAHARLAVERGLVDHVGHPGNRAGPVGRPERARQPGAVVREARADHPAEPLAERLPQPGLVGDHLGVVVLDEQARIALWRASRRSAPRAAGR